MSDRTKLRDDYDADGVRSLAKVSTDAAQTRRLLAVASRPFSSGAFTRRASKTDQSSFVAKSVLMGVSAERRVQNAE